MPGDTLYDRLGLLVDATDEQIRTSYRRLSKTFHPDAGGTNYSFRMLREAYETLSDPGRRAQYDRSIGVDAEPAERGPGSSQRDSAPNGSSHRSNRGSGESSHGAAGAHRDRQRGRSAATALRHLATQISVLIDKVVDRTGWDGRNRANLTIALQAAVALVIGAWSIVVIIVLFDFLLRLFVLLALALIIASIVVVASGTEHRSSLVSRTVIALGFYILGTRRQRRHDEERRGEEERAWRTEDDVRHEHSGSGG